MKSRILLESERLVLREIVEGDYDLLHHLDIDPVVKKFIGPALKEEEIKARHIKAQEEYKNGKGLGKWVATIKDTDEDIGWYVLNQIPDKDMIEIGYRLKVEHWGKGYATEMSRELLDYGFKILKLDRIVGITHLENGASYKVLEKIGLKYRREDFIYNTQVKYYDLTIEEYE